MGNNSQLKYKKRTNQFPPFRFDNTTFNLSLIARRIGMSPGHLSHVFAGRRNPSLALVQKLAREMGMTTEYFVERYEQLRPPQRAA